MEKLKTFEEALKLIKRGERLMREGWNGKGMYIYLEKIDNNRTLTRRPFIVIKDTDEMFVPWVASQTDILAEDWICYKELPIEKQE